MEAIVSRFEKLTGKSVHPWVSRGVVKVETLAPLLDRYEQKLPFYLLVSTSVFHKQVDVRESYYFEFVAWLQRALDCPPVVIQIQDDNTFLELENLTLEESQKLGYDTIRTVIASGDFETAKTFAFLNTEYYGQFYPLLVGLFKTINYATSREVLNLSDSDNIGLQAATGVRAVATLATAFKPIFSGAIAQAFLICRDDDVSNKLQDKVLCSEPFTQFVKENNCPIPKCIFYSEIPPLAGPDAVVTMGKGGDPPTLYTSDTAKELKKKVNKYALSGGRETVELHRELGADLEKDMSYQWLRFLAVDDAEFDELTKTYGSGELLSGGIKAKLIEKVQATVAKVSERVAALEDSQLYELMELRTLL